MEDVCDILQYLEIGVSHNLMKVRLKRSQESKKEMKKKTTTATTKSKTKPNKKKYTGIGSKQDHTLLCEPRDANFHNLSREE